MRVLIFESNLMWSSRLVKSLKALGHEPAVLGGTPADVRADSAIINLGDPKFDPRKLVEQLHDRGIKVIAHAGHKEKELLELGREAGADVLATNSQLTYKLEELLRQVEIPEQS